MTVQLEYKDCAPIGAFEYKGAPTTMAQYAVKSAAVLDRPNPLNPAHAGMGEGPIGEVQFYAAVTGVKDAVGDIITPGAFARTLGERVPRVCLGHDWNRPIGKTVEVKELLPGDPDLPTHTADGKPWPAEAGVLWVKALYNLGTADGKAAFSDAQFMGTQAMYSIGYVAKQKEHKGDTRHLHEVDLYEYGPVLHPANSLASGISAKAAQIIDLETKARYVRDSDFWGLPIGTPIKPGMKPRGKLAVAKRRRGQIPSREAGTMDSAPDAAKRAELEAHQGQRSTSRGLREIDEEESSAGLFDTPERQGTVRAARGARGNDEQHLDAVYEGAQEGMTGRDGVVNGEDRSDLAVHELSDQQREGLRGLLNEGITPDEVDEGLPDDIDPEHRDSILRAYRHAYSQRAEQQGRGEGGGKAPEVAQAPDAPQSFGEAARAQRDGAAAPAAAPAATPAAPAAPGSQAPARVDDPAADRAGLADALHQGSRSGGNVGPVRSPRGARSQLDKMQASAPREHAEPVAAAVKMAHRMLARGVDANASRDVRGLRQAMDHVGIDDHEMGRRLDAIDAVADTLERQNLGGVKGKGRRKAAAQGMREYAAAARVELGIEPETDYRDRRGGGDGRGSDAGLPDSAPGSQPSDTPSADRVADQAAAEQIAGNRGLGGSQADVAAQLAENNAAREGAGMGGPDDPAAAIAPARAQQIAGEFLSSDGRRGRGTVQDAGRYTDGELEAAARVLDGQGKPGAKAAAGLRDFATYRAREKQHRDDLARRAGGRKPSSWDAMRDEYRARQRQPGESFEAYADRMHDMPEFEKIRSRGDDERGALDRGALNRQRAAQSMERDTAGTVGEEQGRRNAADLRASDEELNARYPNRDTPEPTPDPDVETSPSADEDRSVLRARAIDAAGSNGSQDELADAFAAAGVPDPDDAADRVFAMRGGARARQAAARVLLMRAEQGRDTRNSDGSDGPDLDAPRSPAGVQSRIPDPSTVKVGRADTQAARRWQRNQPLSTGPRPIEADDLNDLDDDELGQLADQNVRDAAEHARYGSGPGTRNYDAYTQRVRDIEAEEQRRRDGGEQGDGRTPGQGGDGGTLTPDDLAELDSLGDPDAMPEADPRAEQQAREQRRQDAADLALEMETDSEAGEPVARSRIADYAENGNQREFLQASNPLSPPVQSRATADAALARQVALGHISADEARDVRARAADDRNSRITTAAAVRPGDVLYDPDSPGQPELRVHTTSLDSDGNLVLRAVNTETQDADEVISPPQNTLHRRPRAEEVDTSDGADRVTPADGVVGTGQPDLTARETAAMMAGDEGDGFTAEEDAAAAAGISREELDIARADALAESDERMGVAELPDGDMEVEPEVAERQSRVENMLTRSGSGRLDLSAQSDEQLGSTRRDLVDELALQNTMHRRNPDAYNAPNGRGPARSQREADREAGEQTDALPDETPVAPKRRPGVAGAAEDYADALESGHGVEEARANLLSSLRRSGSSSPAVAELRAHLESDDDDDAAVIRSHVEAMRAETRARRNAGARRRRTAKRLERERIRSLIGQVDTEMRTRSMTPEEHGGEIESAIDMAHGDAIAEAALARSPGLYALTEDDEDRERLRQGKMINAQYRERTKLVEAKAAEAIAAGMETHVKHGRGTTADGEIAWTPEREALHEEIMAEVWAEKVAHVPRDGKAIFSGGLGGAGKGTILGKKNLNIDSSQFATIDPDEIKERLVAKGAVEVPEGVSPMEMATLMHEESSYISKALQKRAFKQRRNVILDNTMAGKNGDKVRKLVGTLRDSGYDQIDAAFVEIPVETSVKRALSRHRNGADRYMNPALAEDGKPGHGGRYVPPAVIRASADPDGLRSSQNIKNFEEVSDLFDNWAHYDNSGAAPEFVKGKGAWATDPRLARDGDDPNAPVLDSPAGPVPTSADGLDGAPNGPPGGSTGMSAQNIARSYADADVKLSDTERAAVGAYIARDYGDINALLRHGPTSRLGGHDGTGRQIAEIDAVMKRWSLPEDAVVYRGVSPSKNGRPGLPSENLTGQTITDRGFMSTSTDLDEAMRGDRDEGFDIAPDPDAVAMELRVPKGTPGIWANAAMTGSGNQGGEYENELILPRGLSMRIVSDERDENGRRRLVAEIAPDQQGDTGAPVATRPGGMTDADVAAAQAGLDDRMRRSDQAELERTRAQEVDPELSRMSDDRLTTELASANDGAAQARESGAEPTAFYQRRNAIQREQTRRVKLRKYGDDPLAGVDMLPDSTDESSTTLDDVDVPDAPRKHTMSDAEIRGARKVGPDQLAAGDRVFLPEMGSTYRTSPDGRVGDTGGMGGMGTFDGTVHTVSRVDADGTVHTRAADGSETAHPLPTDGREASVIRMAPDLAMDEIAKLPARRRNYNSVGEALAIRRNELARRAEGQPRDSREASDLSANGLAAKLLGQRRYAGTGPANAVNKLLGMRDGDDSSVPDSRADGLERLADALDDHEVGHVARNRVSGSEISTELRQVAEQYRERRDADRRQRDSGVLPNLSGGPAARRTDTPEAPSAPDGAGQQRDIDALARMTNAQRDTELTDVDGDGMRALARQASEQAQNTPEGPQQRRLAKMATELNNRSIERDMDREREAEIAAGADPRQHVWNGMRGARRAKVNGQDYQVGDTIRVPPGAINAMQRRGFDGSIVGEGVHGDRGAQEQAIMREGTPVFHVRRHDDGRVIEVSKPRPGRQRGGGIELYRPDHAPADPHEAAVTPDDGDRAPVDLDGRETISAADVAEADADVTDTPEAPAAQDTVGHRALTGADDRKLSRAQDVVHGEDGEAKARRLLTQSLSGGREALPVAVENALSVLGGRADTEDRRTRARAEIESAVAMGRGSKADVAAMAAALREDRDGRIGPDLAPVARELADDLDAAAGEAPDTGMRTADQLQVGDEFNIRGQRGTVQVARVMRAAQDGEPVRIRIGKQRSQREFRYDKPVQVLNHDRDREAPPAAGQQRDADTAAGRGIAVRGERAQSALAVAFEDLRADDDPTEIRAVGGYYDTENRRLHVVDQRAALATLDAHLEMLDSNLDPPGGLRGVPREDVRRWKAEQSAVRKLREQVADSDELVGVGGAGGRA